MSEPNKDRIRLLVNDLRTTEAPQTPGALAASLSDGKIGYCCLGRACEVAIANGLRLPKMTNGHRIQYGDRDEGDATHTILPDAVRNWYGFEDVDPAIAKEAVEGRVGTISATSANDALGWSFAAIANAIEVYYLNDDKTTGDSDA